MKEFEIGTVEEHLNGNWEIVDKTPTPQGFFNYVIQNTKTGDKKRCGGSVLESLASHVSKKKLFGITKIVDVKTLNDLDESDLYFTLGFLAKNATLNMRSVDHENVNTLNKDIKRYSDYTGDVLSEKYHSVNTSSSTWASDLWFTFKKTDDFDISILFSPMNMVGETYKKDTNGNYMLHNTGWIWELIKDFGFRLGKQDVDLIKSHIYSPENIEEFTKGYK